MNGLSPTRDELLRENAALRQKVQALEQSELAHRQTDEARGDSDERFRSLVEATSDWIWEVDTHGRYTYASPKIKDLLGYGPEEVIGKTPFDLMPKEAAVRVAAAFSAIAAARQPFSGLENVNVHKDGRVITLETNGVPIIDAQGHYWGYRGFDRDITERKQSEAALRASQLRLSEATELAHIVYWEYDTQASEFLVNDAYYAFHGTTADQEGGYRMTNEEYAERFVHPDDRARFAEVIAQNRERKDAEFFVDLEHRIVRRDGEVRHVLTRTRVIHDSSASSVRVYGANQDITERKLAEEERERLIRELTKTLSQVNLLSGLLPICSSCKKIRGDDGHWEMMEVYVRDHSQADFSHSICPECARRLYPDFFPEE